MPFCCLCVILNFEPNQIETWNSETVHWTEWSGLQCTETFGALHNTRIYTTIIAAMQLLISTFLNIPYEKAEQIALDMLTVIWYTKCILIYFSSDWITTIILIFSVLHNFWNVSFTISSFLFYPGTMTKLITEKHQHKHSAILSNNKTWLTDSSLVFSVHRQRGITLLESTKMHDILDDVGCGLSWGAVPDKQSSGCGGSGQRVCSKINFTLCNENDKI